MLVSGTSMACRGSYVLTAHMFVSVQFVSVQLLELVLSKFDDDTLSHPRVPYGTRCNYELSIWSICVKFAQPKDH